MLRITIRQLKAGRTRKVESLYEFVYLVRNRKDIFFVGKSETSNIVRVMQRQHLGENYDASISVLGKVIQQNQPESNQWQIELLGQDDIDRIITRDRMVEFQGEYGFQPKLYFTTLPLDIARDIIIHIHGPMLNRKRNPNKVKMPEVYGDNPWWDRGFDYE